MYKNPDCGCCDRWAQYLEANGFTVLKINTNDLASIKEKYRIQTNLAGCHTALIEGYVVEGLVPAKYIKRMLSEHLAVRGLSLPGMPVGAPGMPGQKAGPLVVDRKRVVEGKSGSVRGDLGCARLMTKTTPD